ncbi:hypothetical protein [Pseudoroseomonas ludipueritiae]|uniref:Uncharacterized protein n=1 Tax=Pseudoroseomonas ludipueritiae TaxID=198093 RepID=A0ABR7R4Y2_9PROT|nr:hypothetical protein [Pseudoroseomonas ludipueritiae]MBC9176781.1 hypothetical protein [Pseudoroseomonas ludipueritiae]
MANVNVPYSWVVSVVQLGLEREFPALSDSETLQMARDKVARMAEVAQRPPKPDLHHFKPNRKYPWYCAHCGYAPHEPLKHIQPKAEEA